MGQGGVLRRAAVPLISVLSLGALAACGDSTDSAAPAGTTTVSAQHPDAVAAAERAVYNRVGNMLVDVRAEYPGHRYVQTDGPAVCRPISDFQLDCTQRMRDDQTGWTGTSRWRATVEPKSGKPALEEHGGKPLTEQLGIAPADAEGDIEAADGEGAGELKVALRDAGLAYESGSQVPSDVVVVPAETALTGRTGRVNVERHVDASAAKRAQREYVRVLARPEAGRGVVVGSFFVWMSSIESEGLSATERRDFQHVVERLRAEDVE